MGYPRRFHVLSHLIVPAQQRRISCIVGLECLRTTRVNLQKILKIIRIEWPTSSWYRRIRSPRLTKGADDHKVSPPTTWLPRSWLTENVHADNHLGISACHQTHCLGMTKGADNHMVPPHVIRLAVSRWQKVRITIRYPPHVIGLAVSRWQKVQKTTLVSTCQWACFPLVNERCG